VCEKTLFLDRDSFRQYSQNYHRSSFLYNSTVVLKEQSVHFSSGKVNVKKSSTSVRFLVFFSILFLESLRNDFS